MYDLVNPYLENKRKRYEAVTKSDCFLRNLYGLAAIELNITEMCSRRCSFCPRSNPKVYKNQKLNMEINTVRRLAQECEKEKYEGEFSFAGFGEPMLHPNLPSLVLAIRESCKKNFIGVITNGDFLIEETANDLVSAGVNKIVVSCYDGPKERDGFLEILSKLPIETEVKELWETQPDFNNRTGIVNVGSEHHGKCYYPFYKLVVDWNGDILLCAQDWLRKQKGLGNINTNTLQDIWNNTARTKVQFMLSHGERVGVCAGCNVCGTLIGKESFDLFGGLLVSNT